MTHSSFVAVAELAAKMRREETYHLMHFDVWLRRLAEGGDETRERLRQALGHLWPDAQAIFAPLAGEAELLAAGILPEPMAGMRARWQERVQAGVAAVGLPALDDGAAAEDGRTRRTDDFAWLHGQFTLVARSDEAATW